MGVDLPNSVALSDLMSDSASEHSNRRETTGGALLAVSIVVAAFGAVASSIGAQEVAYILFAGASTAWLIGCIAVGVRIGLRESRADN